MDIDYQEFCDLTEAIQALTDRVSVMEAFFGKHVRECHPVTAPVLNDGKADPVHEAICKAPDNTFICQQCGHVHELPQFQRPPFVTGLSVVDTLKK
jgi:hypothetical protein